MSKAQRAKGQRGERKAAEALRAVFPDAARDLNDVYAGRGIDLTNTGRLAVQVKHYATHAPISKLAEVKPANGQIPVLISWPTARGSQPAVVLALDDFVRILSDVGEAYE